MAHGAADSKTRVDERGDTERCAHIVLYRSDGSDQDLALEAIAPPEDDDDLLWVDIDCDAPDLIGDVARRLGLPEAAHPRLLETGSAPQLHSYGDHLVIQAVVVEHVGDLRFEGTVLTIASGPDFVLTVHDRPIGFIRAIRKREHGETRLGMLDEESFVVSLLDWQLGSYFEAVSDFERAVERLEEDVLRDRHDESTRELSRLRKGASRLRRMLAPHRRLFASLARPDFHPEGEDTVGPHFVRVYENFERAMDVVENARELVIGSFELFTNQIALRTNNAMRMLTFATVVIGCQTVIAGVLGMNFDAPFFETAARGFWIAIGAMLVVTACAVVLGKRRGWF
ncbi:MAG TPA: CorA family divalent cation transporter [Lysobacter sp.]